MEAEQVRLDAAALIAFRKRLLDLLREGVLDGSMTFMLAKNHASNQQMEDEFKDVQSVAKLMRQIDSYTYLTTGSLSRGFHWWTSMQERCRLQADNATDVIEEIKGEDPGDDLVVKIEVDEHAVESADFRSNGDGTLTEIEHAERALSAEQKFQIYQFKILNPTATFPEMSKILSEKFQAEVEK